MKVKNKIKQILSIIVTAMMMMSLFTVSAFATPQSNGFNPGRDKGTIKVKLPSSVASSNAKYKAYKILEASEETGTNSIYKYTVTNDFENLIGNGKPYELTAEGKIKKADGTVINDPTAPNNAEMQNFAKAVADFINTNKVTATTPEFAINTAQEVGIGYYAVLQTKADGFIQSIPIVVDVPHVTYNATAPNTFNYEYEIDIDTKVAGVPTVDKKIVEGTNRVEKNDVSIGDTVTYEITSTIPKYPANTDLSKVSYYLTDTLSKGLTFGSVTSVVAKATGKDDLTLSNTQYDLTKTDNTNADNTIRFSFNNKDDAANKFNTIKDYDSIVITYTATLNENAVIASVGNPNKVYLTYTNDPSTGSTADTTEITVVTYTYKVDVVKQDSVTDSKKLEGAEFKLQKKESDSDEYSDVANMYILKDGKNVLVGSIPEGSTEKIKAETAADGTLVFTGLDEGSYRLVETKAPEGYVLPANANTDFTITASSKDGKYTIGNVSGNNSSVSNNIITILNIKGVNLPQTGGAGTWMFTIGGLVLMAGAVVVFMATRKKKAN